MSRLSLAKQLVRLAKKLAATPEIKALGKGTYSVKVNGKEVARADVADDGRGDYISNVRVDKEYRRRGIATLLYQFIENDLGRTLKP